MRKWLISRLPDLHRRAGELGRDDGGQVIVEYLLMMSAMLVTATVIGTGFKRMLTAVWERIAKDVAAPCPGCNPPPEVRFR